MTYVFHSKILSGVSRYYSVLYQIEIGNMTVWSAYQSFINRMIYGQQKMQKCMFYENKVSDNRPISRRIKSNLLSFEHKQYVEIQPCVLKYMKS
jgi:hypothetical protein